MREMFSSRLRVLSSDSRYLKAIYEAMHPDNQDTPCGMTINDYIVEVKPSSYEYVVEIKVSGEKAREFDSLRGALDDILSILSSISKLSIMLK